MSGETFKIKSIFSLNKKYKPGSKNKSSTYILKKKIKSNNILNNTLKAIIFLHPKKKIKAIITVLTVKRIKTDYNIII